MTGTLSPEPARVLIVGDSIFVRRTLRAIFQPVPDLVVVGEATEGREALEKVAALSPSVITLDLRMPGMDGLTTLRALRESWPDLPVFVLASSSPSGAAAALEALSLGAFDFVDKSASTPMDLHLLGPQIVAKLRAMLGSRRGRPARAAANEEAFGSTLLPRDAGIVCLGASTGGPPSIQRLLESLPGSFPLPVTIVQHMPAGFTGAFAERLNRLSPLEVKEAEEADEVRTGRVLVARAGRHLLLAKGPRGAVVHLSRSPEDAIHVPSVDSLFHSAAETFGARVIAVVLSGMGSDGREGARALAKAGAFIVAEAEESCTVYGMPKALVDAGLTRAIWPLGELIRRLAAIG
jgi:two-component system chemotaxis response regulator CheB